MGLKQSNVSLPSISFLLVACGSAVYDHSKSQRVIWPPILTEVLSTYSRLRQCYANVE